MNIKVNLADGTPVEFKTEIIDGNLVVTVVEEEKKDLFPKWEELGWVSGHFVKSDSEIGFAMNYNTAEVNQNIFTTSELAKAALATARVSQTYRRYRELVGDMYAPIVRKYGLLRMTFASLSDWDNFFDANEEDFKLILNAANTVQL